MGSDPDSFVHAVRNSKVKQPTQRGFSSQRWKEYFNSVDRRSDNDCRVYESGLWFDSKLTEIRKKLEGFPESKLSVDTWLRLYTAFVNRDYKVALDAPKKVQEQRSEETVFVGELIDQRLPIGRTGQPVNMTAVIESSVSAIRYPLAQLLIDKRNISQSKLTSDAEILKIIAARLNLAVLYDGFSDFWGECFWNGWSVKNGNKQDLVIPPATQEYISRVISEYRADCLLMEITWRCLNLWGKMPRNLKQIELNRPRITALKRRRKRKYLELGNAVDSGLPSPDFIIRIAAEELYWNEILIEPLPALDGLTIRDLLIVWDLLASLGQVLESKLPDHTGVSNTKKLLEFAPTIPASELRKAISNATKLSAEQVSLVLRLFTFSGDVRDDPWLKPLIPLGKEKYTAIISALTFPNLIRSIESWMKEGKLDLDKRGDAFEDFVRDELANDLKNSKYLTKSQINKHSLQLKVGDEFEEIDLVWLIGAKVLIGEIKCSIYPTSPIEIYHYFKVLQRATEQVKRKVQFVEADLDNLLSGLGLSDSMDPSQLTVYPMVVTNLPLGVGIPVKHVPIVDLRILRRYIEGYQKFFVETSVKGEERTHQLVQYYDSEAEAEKNVIEYLKAPPLISIFTKLLDKEVAPFVAVNRKSKPCGYVRLFVNAQKIKL